MPLALAAIGLGLIAGVFLLPDLLPEESELVPVEPPRDEALVPPRPSAEPPLPEVADVEPVREPVEPLPPLSRSDGWVRVEAAALSERPAWKQWLQTEDLVRRFVAAVDEVAAGNSPTASVPFLRPRGGFGTVVRGGTVVTDPRSFRRYDVLAEVVASLDAELCAALYRRAAPLVEEAFADLGYPDTRFEERLEAALELLLATPVPSGREVLVQPAVRWEYQDERLEGLEPAQKQLLRMGPDNVRRVQDKLRELARALGLAVG